MRFALAILFAASLLTKNAIAQTPSVQTVDAMTLTGSGANVALGKDASGGWKVYFQNLTTSSLWEWDPYTNDTVDHVVGATDVSSRGPFVFYVDELVIPLPPPYEPIEKKILDRFPVGASPGTTPLDRTTSLTALRSDPLGNAIWKEDGATFIWEPGANPTSIPTSGPPYSNAPNGELPVRYGDFLIVQKEGATYPWEIHGYYFDAPDPNDANTQRPMPHKLNIEPQGDLFEGSIVHRSDVDSLEVRVVDAPHDIKKVLPVANLCQEIHHPRAGGLSGEFWPRFAVFHGTDCVDGPSSLYLMSTHTGTVYFVDRVPSSPTYETLEDGLAYIDNAGQVHFLRLDMTVLPAY